MQRVRKNLIVPETILFGNNNNNISDRAEIQYNDNNNELTITIDGTNMLTVNSSGVEAVGLTTTLPDQPWDVNVINTELTTIDTNIDSIATTSNTIATNTNNTASNTNTIATNTTSIDTNTANTSTNTGTIATNTTSINTNTSTIATNTTSIDTNTSNTSTNTGTIATNTTSISTNTGNTATNTGTIVTNTNSIVTNTGNTSTNTGTIVTNTNSIATSVSSLDSKLPINNWKYTYDRCADKNISVFAWHGHMDSLSTTYREICSSLIDNESIYVGNGNSAITLSIACTNNSFTETVNVSGYNSSGTLINENIAVTGQTAKALVNQYIRIREIYRTAGVIGTFPFQGTTGVTYVGTGTFATGKPPSIACALNNQYGVSASSHIYVPVGQSLYLTQINASLGHNGDRLIRLIMQTNYNVTGTGWLSIYEYTITSNSSFTLNCEAMPAFVGGCDIRFIGIGLTAITSFFDLYVQGFFVTT